VWPAATYESYAAFGGISSKAYFNNYLATNAYDVNRSIARVGTKVDR